MDYKNFKENVELSIISIIFLTPIISAFTTISYFILFGIYCFACWINPIETFSTSMCFRTILIPTIILILCSVIYLLKNLGGTGNGGFFGSQSNELYKNALRKIEEVNELAKKIE